MGGHSKKAGKGGGGAGRNSARSSLEARKKLTKDPGVPDASLRNVGELLMRREGVKQRRVINVPRLSPKGRASLATSTPTQTAVGTNSDDRCVGEMASLALGVRQRALEYESLSAEARKEELGEGNERRDLSLRRFYKDFQRVVNSSDVILEVIDARDPLGCRLVHLEHRIATEFGDRKHVVVVLNKADLVPTQVVVQWVEYFEREGLPVVPFTAAASGAAQSEKAACCARLLRQLRTLSRGEDGRHKYITVGIIGYPNVGKSSIINVLRRKTVVGVGNTPGFTTGNTEVDLRTDLKIMDSPGVVMPGEDTGDVVLRNAARIDNLDNPMLAVERLVQRCYPVELAAVYDVGLFSTAEEFVELVALRRGRIRRGGVLNEDETCRIILKDWNDGRIGYYTVPPSESTFLSTLGGRTSDFDDRSELRVRADAREEIQLEGLPTFHLQINNR